MNFLDLRVQFEVAVNEKSPHHPHLFQARVVGYSSSSDPGAVKKSDTVQVTSRKGLDRVERQGRKTYKENLWDSADGRANELMDMGILLGEVYDGQFDEDMLGGFSP